MSRILYEACAPIEEESIVGLEVEILGVFRVLILKDKTRKLNMLRGLSKRQ